MRDAISEYILKFPDVSLRTSQIIEKKNRLAQINKGLVDANRYKTLQSTLSKLINEQKNISQNLQLIEELDNLFQGFLILESDLECSCPLISRQGLYLKLTLPADVDILAESDNPTHYADGFHCNARSPLQGYAMPFLHSVSA